MPKLLIDHSGKGNVFTKTSQWAGRVILRLLGRVPPVITPEEITEAHELEAEFQRLEAHCVATQTDVAEREWRKKSEDYVANPTDDKFRELVDGQKSEKEFLARYRTLNNLANAAKNTFCAEKVRPFIVPIIRACAKAVEADADAKAKRDFEEAEALGIPYVESETVLALRTRARNIEVMADTVNSRFDSQGSPLALLKEAGLDIPSN